MSKKENNEPYEVYSIGGGRWTLVRPNGAGFEHLGVFESPEDAKKFASGAGVKLKIEN